MLYRYATPDDLLRPDLWGLIMRGLQAERVSMVVDRDKISGLMRRALTEGFWMLAEQDGKIVGHIGAAVVENMWYERQQLVVIAWFSEFPGAGFGLLRRLLAWKNTNPMIGSVTITTNPGPRLQRLLELRGWLMCPTYLKAC